MRVITWVAALGFSGLLATGCDNEASPVADAAAPGAETRGRGGWDIASAEASLRAAGLHPVRAGSVQQPFLSVPGVVFRSGDSEIQIYVYPDHAARAADTHKLDPHRVAPGHMMVTWRMPPTLVLSDNVAAIVLTHEQAVRDHARRALAHPVSGSPHG